MDVRPIRTKRDYLDPIELLLHVMVDQKITALLRGEIGSFLSE